MILTKDYDHYNNGRFVKSFKEGDNVEFDSATMKNLIGTGYFEKGTETVELTEDKAAAIEDFYSRLIGIDGIGEKTATDLIGIFATFHELENAVATEMDLPISDTIKEKLINHFKLN